VSLLYQLATMEHHPESVPINALVAVEGSPSTMRIQSIPTSRMQYPYLYLHLYLYPHLYLHREEASLRAI
jgi:hypothetical protein